MGHELKTLKGKQINMGLDEKNDSRSSSQGSKWKRNDPQSYIRKNGYESRPQGSKQKRNDCGSQMKNMTLGHEIQTINGIEMTMVIK